ncbi:MAG: hypothetical protein KC466_15305 [Myxococcales bacterium]|nr:hypothetical protein [Myxococcales bacterium]
MRQIGLVVLLALAVGGYFVYDKIVERLDAEEVMVVQSPIIGKLTWYTSPGLKWQGLGKVTRYPKRSIYTFNIPVRFNDGGHANMIGSIQWEMPTDEENLRALHVRFGSADAIQRQLIETITNKAAYMTGPLMSSKESYAEKRNDLISYVEDQISNGVYKTRQKEVKTTDIMTGTEKTVTVVEIAMENGLPVRQEEAVLKRFGIRPFNFSIETLKYDDIVERQIQQQQEIFMDVQTAIADAKKAEQRAITVAKQGEASAAEAKWKQEVIKAKAVTEAEQQLEVARLGAQAAEQYKAEQLLRADGDATYKREVMQADGALQQKLEALVAINKAYAQAIENHQGPWVPNIVMGGGTQSQGGASQAVGLVDLLTAKAAKDLSLDLSLNTTQTPPARRMEPAPPPAQ